MHTAREPVYRVSSLFRAPFGLRLNSGTELSFLHFIFTFDGTKGEEQCSRLSIG
jgi:hypothetical protein